MAVRDRLAPQATYVDMTETIVTFAEPLLAEIPPETEEQMVSFFKLVIDIWNMWVASAPPWNDSRGLDEIADALANDKLTRAEKYIHNILAQRWAAAFRDDGRLVVDTNVTHEDGSPVFRCFGCAATPDLIATFKGTPS